MCAVSKPLIWDLSRAGCMLNRLATKAKLSLLLPDVTSRGETNCLQSSRAACCSISSALRCKSYSFISGIVERLHHRFHKVAWKLEKSKVTHIQAAHVDFDVSFIVVLFMQSDLVQQVEVGLWILQKQNTRVGYTHVSSWCLWVCKCCEGDLNIFTEVSDGRCSCVLEMVIDPAQQEFFRGERHQVVQSLPISQKTNQT